MHFLLEFSRDYFGYVSIRSEEERKRHTRKMREYFDVDLLEKMFTRRLHSIDK